MSTTQTQRRPVPTTSIVITMVNLAILVMTVILQNQPASAVQSDLPVLRAKALEILDAQGRVRASLSVQEPATVDGVSYPETVLLRLTDPTSGPVVKLSASVNGSALGLSDDADGGIQLFARDRGSYVKVVDKQGRESVVKP